MCALRVLAVLAALHVVSSQNATVLYPDSPQSGTVARFGYAYYYINIAALQNYLGITVLVTSGDCSLYVGANFMPTISSYTYKNDTHTGTTRDILITNPPAPAYYIAVYGYSQCAYQVSAGTQGIINMQEMIQYGGHVEYKAFVYYQFDVPANVDEMEIVLVRTSTAGDPDAYVSLNAVPNTTVAQWKNTTNTINTCLYWSLPTAGHYYYGVYGYGACDYNTQLSFNSGSTCQLRPTMLTTEAIGVADQGKLRAISVKVSDKAAIAAEEAKFLTQAVLQ